MSRSTWLLFGATALAVAGCAGRTESGNTGGGAGTDAGTGGSGAMGGTGGVVSSGGSGGGTGGVVSSGGTGGVVSSGGSGGVISIGGSGGSIGTGGAGTTCSSTSPAPPQPACGAALCGNGRIDTCNSCPDGGYGGYPGGPGGPPCQSDAEQCDGTALGGASCKSLGFPGGTLRCSSVCRYDTAACTRCSAPGGHLAACVESVAGAQAPSALSIAATAQEIGVAWISRQPGSAGVWFARFKPDLSLIKKSGPFGADCPTSVALSVRPGGWDVATSGYSHPVEVYAIDSSGNVTKLRTVAAAGHGAVFGARPGGAPLLAWIDDGAKALRATVLSTDGVSTTPVATLPMPGGVVDSWVASTFVSDGFLVATREYNRVVVGRVATDGTTTGALTQPVPDETEVPALTASGGEARMVYEHFGPAPVTVEMVRLDKSGKALASPVVIGAAPDYYNNAYPVADGTDTLVVMGNYTASVYQAKHLDVIRVDSSGNKLWGPQTIATDPTMLTGYGAAMSGTELVSAFIEGGSLYPVGVGLARVTP